MVSVPLSLWRLQSEAVSLGVTSQGGMLDRVRFHFPTGTVEPLHTAPWAGEHLSAELPPMLRGLRGDFFCAPFGESDLTPEESRPHGASANGTWHWVGGDDHNLELSLDVSVMGARVRKYVGLRPGHHAVYQEHTLSGGHGALPLGHHVMLRADNPLLLSFSRWIWGGTPPEPLEPDPARGRSRLKYPQTFNQLEEVMMDDGTPVNLTRFPTLDGSEELLMLCADTHSQFAWSAATNPVAGWVWFALKNPRTLQSTVLWLSHGGRDYPPFSGRHRGVIGLEEVTAYFHLGHRASVSPNALHDRGIPTAVDLGETLSVRTVFGMVRVPASYGRVSHIGHDDEGITLTDTEGIMVRAPLDISWVSN